MPSLDLSAKLLAAKQRLSGGSSGSVFKGMATLALGSGMAKIIGLLSIQVLTRIYSPEDFGLLSVFTAMLLILTPLMTLRYELAVPLPSRDGAAMTLMALSSALLVLMTFVVGTVLWLAGPTLLSLISMDAVIPYRGLLVIALFLTALYEVLQIWAVRRRAYPIIARTQLQQSVVGAVAKIGLGVAGLMPLGLLLGHVIGAGAGMMAVVRAFHGDVRHFWRHVTLHRARTMLRHYRGFPIYRLPAQLLQIFSSQSPLLLTAAIYDAGTTGQLGLALMTLALPMNLLGYTTSKAYYAEIASLGRKRPKEIRAVTHSVIKRLLALSIAPALVLLAFGEGLFALAFGAQWELAGQLAAILAIYLLFQFIHAPASHLLSLFERQRLLLMLNIQRTALTVACFTAAHFLDLPITSVVLLYSITLSAHYLFSLLMSLRVIPR
ncbi:lipopolysaccharide biosynthesis protein [Stutzerimonas stutzeri]|uniref:lipopolysaccharide biosynthesis protein n=1 Tax=Stutzerimonas stutzeri TaxID=316 RepID=UPI0021097B4E|nr:oligosaccharide flippase family protein [Stutzerimonas stutzeri]MCQ4257594.1 oligosaccharide flippase family protein [Stutzerimonas stutzeri]